MNNQNVVMVSTLYRASFKTIIKSLDFLNGVTLLWLFKTLPSSILHQLLEEYRDEKWKEIYEDVNNTEDGYNDFYKKFRLNDFYSLENYYWGTNIECKNLLKYLIWENDWEFYYTHKRICIKFKFYTFNYMFICSHCYQTYTSYCSLYGNTKSFDFILSEFHEVISPESLFKYTRDCTNWCSWCISTPLFEVESLKECRIKFHKTIVSYTEFDNDSDYDTD